MNDEYVSYKLQDIQKILESIKQLFNNLKHIGQSIQERGGKPTQFLNGL